jgi:putative endonuclease
MFKVYFLYSKNFNKIYIGFSSNLDERIKSHNELATKGWTIRYRPWELIYFETFDSKAEAMKREKELKSYKGRSFLKSKLQNTLDG